MLKYLRVLDVLAFLVFCFGFEMEKLREMGVISISLQSLAASPRALQLSDQVMPALPNIFGVVE